MRIGVFVGSFNPVHNGHTKVINYLLENNYVDKLIVIPTGNYWDKTDLINLEKRTEMLKLACSKNIVDSSLGKYEYTYEILNELKNKYINDNLYLIIGADNMENFHKWKNVDLILKHNVIVLNRNNLDVNKYVNKFKEHDKFIIINDFQFIEISSSYIKCLCKKREFKELEKYLNHEVIEYIEFNHLYLC